jgi:hypothetical protein
MRLNLALNGMLIASTAIDPSRCKDEFYMQAMQRVLREQNQDALELFSSRPVFFIEVPAGSAALSYQNRHQ